MNNNFMCFPEGKMKALTFSYDDGEKRDARLVELFNKYGLKGTFNLNSGLMAKSEKTPSSKIALEKIDEVYKGHEVAVHTAHHPFLEKLPKALATREIIKDRETLEKYAGYVVRGMAYPFGTYNDNVVEICDACGIKYSRTVEAHHSFKIPTDWLRMPSTCHHADEKVFELADTFVNGSPRDKWTNVEGWLFYIWGHSFEFRSEEDWARMEELCKKLADKDDVWYATNIEIYDYVEAYRSLEYSMDQERVYNPSAKDVWLIYEGETYKIPSGKEVKLG